MHYFEQIRVKPAKFIAKMNQIWPNLIKNEPFWQNFDRKYALPTKFISKMHQVDEKLYRKCAILMQSISKKHFFGRSHIKIAFLWQNFYRKLVDFLIEIERFWNIELQKISSLKYPFLYFSVLEALKSQIIFFEFLMILNCSDCIYSTFSKNGAREHHHFYSILLHLFTPLWWWGILLVESIRRIQMLNLWKTLNSSSTDIFQFNLWFLGLLNII